MRSDDEPAKGAGAPAMDVVPTREGYEQWAGLYDGEDNPLILLEERCLPELTGEVAGLEVADIGCGTGRHAVRLAQAGAWVTALDFSEAMLSCARSKPGADAVRFVAHDVAEPLPLTDASFDRVFCCLVLDHISDLKGFFGELKRICRLEGKVIMSVMHPAMNLRGAQARFIEPGSGKRISPRSYSHQLSDYIMAGLRAGLRLEAISEHVVDSELATRSPRAQRYVGWPMLLLMAWAPGRL